MNKSLIKFICSVAIFGTIGVFVRNIALSSGEIAFWRAVIAVAFLCAYKLIKREKLPLQIGGANMLRLVISGALVGFNWILLFEAYNYTTVSVATLCYYFAPTLIMVLSPLIFMEKRSLKNVLFFLLATAGLVLIIGTGDRAGGDTEIYGILLGLGAAVLYATIVLLNKKVTGVGGIDKTLIQFVSAAVVLVVYVPLTSGFQIGGIDTGGLILLLVLGLVHTGFAYCLYFGSVAELRGQKVAILSYIDPLVAVIVSVLFLQETVTVWQLVGGAMIIVFSLLNELSDRKAKERA